ncbi:hypothetical protein MCO_00562 [Bartonella sp. DB5-6]|nr:hypothetical protein MCO_00562 [Bartonella sp. DB5-6]
MGKSTKSLICKKMMSEQICNQTVGGQSTLSFLEMS